MSGLLTYNQSARPTSQLVGLALRQAFIQLFLTNTQVAAATTAQDLIDNVNAAIVGPGSEANGQRESIVRAIREGKALGDLSDARIQAATTVEDLVQDTWASDLPANYLGPNLVP
jgi:hypothetical protein